MKTSEAMLAVSEIAASQWGMLTARQAADVGLERIDLSRLAQAGQVVRLNQGVYRDAGAPADELEELRAAWLSMDPSRTAGARLRDGSVVVSGASAAVVHGIGDLRAGVHEFSIAKRKQSQRPDVRIRKRELPASSVTIVRGLPVTTVGQTLADLVNDSTDLTLVAQAFRDAVTRGLSVAGMGDLITAAAARRNGAIDGAAVVERVAQLAGLDDKSVVEAVLRTPAGTQAMAEQISRLRLPNSSEAVASLRSTLQRAATPLPLAATQPALAAMMKSIQDQRNVEHTGLDHTEDTDDD
ncbi:type IV toxin-antitoxin system AbiEi family antitoxin domain-containing protein [Leifsonia sp. NPDC058194]|uniref:type IV toxin-antitoxin system AbiEi family antitoxin domain-containing protein n=1 Tax=Leifsonia sp. NPDC058194 TaxID=3346374 RepID=UPI0036D92BE6